jgi:hypothetical protein
LSGWLGATCLINVTRHPTAEWIAQQITEAFTLSGQRRLNHFGQGCWYPLNLEAAVRNLFTGQVTKVDVGEVNGSVFVNNSAWGFIHISCAKCSGHLCRLARAS